jgi:hypothetical protein
MLADPSIDGDVRCHLTAAKVFDEGHHVIGLVGTERDAVACLAAV